MFETVKHAVPGALEQAGNQRGSHLHLTCHSTHCGDCYSSPQMSPKNDYTPLEELPRPMEEYKDDSFDGDRDDDNLEGHPVLQPLLAGSGSSPHRKSPTWFGVKGSHLKLIFMILALGVSWSITGYELANSSIRSPVQHTRETSSKGISAIQAVGETERLQLRVKLQVELDKLVAKYPLSFLDPRWSFGTSDLHHESRTALGNAMTLAYFNITDSFLIGVTGGSSTAGGEKYWPYLMQQHLREHVGFSNVFVRNAAKGGTGQFINSPCFQSLLGNKGTDRYSERTGEPMDLLLWEFAMNDGLFYYQKYREDEIMTERARRRSSETWIRAGLDAGVTAFGFLHLWEARIHEWEWGMEDTPNRAWRPTNDIMQKYGSVAESFSVNAFDFIYQGGIPDRINYANASKTDFLMDEHHPLLEIHPVFGEFMAAQLIKIWIDWLDAAPQAMYEPLPGLDLIIPGRNLGDEVDLPAIPSRDIRSHCLVAPTPQFGHYNPMSLVCHDGEIEWMGSTSRDVMESWPCEWNLTTRGKHFVDRSDYNVYYEVPMCSTGKKLRLRVREVQNWKYFFIQCDLKKLYDCTRLQITVDGAEIPKNVVLHYNDNLMYEGVDWAHDFGDNLFTYEGEYVEVQMCTQDNPANMDPTRVIRFAIYNMV
ncbi:hypothetical protein T439DRAFT_346000 [Meredithblackwellia eburnea MCA 4105]